MTGFEPATTRSQSDHSTRLNYIPITFQKSHLSGRASIWWLGSMSHPLFPFWNIKFVSWAWGDSDPRPHLIFSKTIFKYSDFFSFDKCLNSLHLTLSIQVHPFSKSFWVLTLSCSTIRLSK